MSSEATPGLGAIPVHTRSLVVEAFRGERGDVRLEGVILDLRKVGFVPTGGELQTAGFIHHMKLGLDVDPDSLRITGLETAQPTVAFEPTAATGGDCCRDPADRLQALVGEPLGGDFPRRLARVFGGPLGCSHLLTLGQLLGASAPRFLAGARVAERTARERIAKRALFVDGFEREDGGLDLSIQLSEFRLAPSRTVAHPLDRLAAQHEVQVRAALDSGLSTLARLEARERARDAGSLDAPWRDRSACIASLEGAPALGGLASRVLRLLGERDEDGPLRDALLNLAPGVIQCLAAFSHRLLASFAGERPAAALPRELTVGGSPDSCYMWRSGGPMAVARAAAARTPAAQGGC
jgi:hypothetical protein